MLGDPRALRHLVKKMTECKRGKKRERQSQKDREGQGREGLSPSVSEVCGGRLLAQRAWFSSLALGLMTVFIQLWYQTFPFPARRSPL